jgi:hypothetical protein
MEAVANVLSIFIYVAMIFFAAINPHSVTIGIRPVEKPITAMLLMALIYPFIGLIFTLMSLVTGFIGWFLYSPIVMLWQYAT